VESEDGGGLPDRIRLLRLERGWKQAALAARLGVDHSTVSAWERGRQVPAPATLDALATALGVPVADLCARQDQPPRRDDDVDRQRFLAGLACCSV